jgi:hypothetical protein
VESTALTNVLGLFEILVPGLFLLVNLAIVTYALPFTDTGTRDAIIAMVHRPGVGVLVGVLGGYVLGVALRLWRTKTPDSWSAAWMRRFHPRKRLFTIEGFPYTITMQRRIRRTGHLSLIRFYEQTFRQSSPGRTLGQRRRVRRGGFLAFDIYKWLVSGLDPYAAKEISAAEALSRFVSGMFYALLVTIAALTATALAEGVWTHRVHTGLVIVALLYIGIIVVILGNFRLLRMYEVEKVIALAYLHRDQLNRPSA